MITIVQPNGLVGCPYCGAENKATLVDSSKDLFYYREAFVCECCGRSYEIHHKIEYSTTYVYQKKHWWDKPDELPELAKACYGKMLEYPDGFFEQGPYEDALYYDEESDDDDED